MSDLILQFLRLLLAVILFGVAGYGMHEYIEKHNALVMMGAMMCVCMGVHFLLEASR